MVNKPDIDQLYRTMMIIWFVLLLTQVALFGFSYSMVGPAVVANAEAGFFGTNPLIIVLALILAFTNLALSLILRKKSLDQSIEEQNPRLVQTGLVIACALCESISLIGMILLVAFNYPYFYLWFALGILGIFFHFPRRQQLIDASFSQNWER